MDQTKSFLSTIKAIVDTFSARLYPKIILPHVDLHNKRALVTGANVGLGKAIAASLAGQGAEVYLLCRSHQKAEEARADIVKETGNSKVFVEVIDLGSLQSVREFIERWGQRSTGERSIDILINNAGKFAFCWILLDYAYGGSNSYHNLLQGLSTGTKITSPEGFELTYAVNALGSFALTVGLLQKTYLSSNARVVSVSSVAMYSAALSSKAPTTLNSPDLLHKFSEGDAIPPNILTALYQRSKALQVIFTIELQERLRRDGRYRDVVVQCCHPGKRLYTIAPQKSFTDSLRFVAGNVITSMYSRSDGVASDPGSAKFMKFLAENFGVSPPEGAVTPVWLATSDIPAQPAMLGKYWERIGWKWIPAWMHDAEQRKILWDLMARDAQLEGVY